MLFAPFDVEKNPTSAKRTLNIVGSTAAQNSFAKEFPDCSQSCRICGYFQRSLSGSFESTVAAMEPAADTAWRPLLTQSELRLRASKSRKI